MKFFLVSLFILSSCSSLNNKTDRVIANEGSSQNSKIAGLSCHTFSFDSREGFQESNVKKFVINYAGKSGGFENERLDLIYIEDIDSNENVRSGRHRVAERDLSYEGENYVSQQGRIFAYKAYKTTDGSSDNIVYKLINSGMSMHTLLAYEVLENGELGEEPIEEKGTQAFCDNF